MFFNSLEDLNQVIYLSFDRYNGEKLFDNTVHNNNATLANGALVDKVVGSCGMCARLLGGNIVIDGAKFVGKPPNPIILSLKYVNL